MSKPKFDNDLDELKLFGGIPAPASAAKRFDPGEIRELERQTRAQMEMKRLIETLYAKHPNDQDAAFDEFKQYVENRPDLADAAAGLTFTLTAIEEGLIPRRDH
jgi:hypothetical protein